MIKGGVFIISGPSGSGKDTVMKELFAKEPDLLFSISSITRPMREGEVEGEKYNFISREQFESMIANQQLLEYNEYLENYYGTPKLPVEEAVNAGKDMVIEVDVNGAFNIKKHLPDAVSIFIMPPSFEELKNRLKGRNTESKEDVEKRLNEAITEISRATEYDYIVVNDDIFCAVEDIISIIKSLHLKTTNKENFINEVLLNAKS